MKKIITLLWLLVSLQYIFAQTQPVGSLKPLLANVSSPRQKFTIIRSYLEKSTCLEKSSSGQTFDYDSAYAIELLKIAQQEKNDSMLAISYNWIGSYLSQTKSDNISALEYFFKAIPLAEKAKDKRRISSLYFDIAVVYIELQNFEEAFKNTVKGGEYLPEKTSALYNFMLVQYQQNTCIYYLATNQTDSALHYAQLVSATAEIVNSNMFTFLSFTMSGAAYAEKKDTEMADVWFKRANAMATSIHRNSTIGLFYLQYINFLVNNKRVREAKNISEHLLNLGNASNNNILKLEGAGFLRQVYDSLHQTDSAYYYARTEATLNALIFNQNNINKMQALAFNEQIRKIEEEAKEKKLEEQRRQNIEYALIALGIIIFITVFLLLSRTVIVNEKLISFFAILGLLIIFEFINLLIHPSLARFTHESPVLMLLALVLIAALLIPLHHRLEHWIKEKMVEKNKSIRLAAAKKNN